MIDLSGDRPVLARKLDALVGAKRFEILRRWKERVRTELGEHLPEPELVDSMPPLLADIAEALRSAAPSHPADARRAVGSRAGAHGAQRAALGVGIDELVWEYGVLGDVILDLVEEEGLLPTLEEVRAVARVVSAIVADAVSAHAAERDRLAREAKERESEFEQQLIAIVSHDLRTPLGTISLGARTLLGREDLAEPHRRGLTRILSAADQALRLIRDLLDLGRDRLGGEIPVERRDVDLRAPVTKLVEVHRAASPDREIRLAVAGDVTGRWDADRVLQALGNLVTNAIQHGAPGTPISIALDGSGDALRLSVHSLGEPIPAEVLPSLFQAGARHSANRADGGLGLGLFIVERIASAHGGNVSVSSTREAGTTFTVVLPRDATS